MRRLLIKKLCATIVLEAYLEVKMRFSRDKNFYKTLLALSLPIALQDLIKFGLNMADNLMVGRLGETALSAVSIANQPFFLFSLISFGLASGGSVLVAQYYGKQENRAISPIFSIALIIALCASVICGTIVLLFPESIMSIFVPGEPDVIALGAKYLRIVSITYFTYGLSNTIILLLRGVELVRPTLIINIISFFINVALNWVLIFGKLGAPALGVEGAAIATVAARLFDVIAIMIYILRIDKKLNFNLRNLFSPSRKLFPDFVKYSIPVTLNETMWGLGILMISVVLGRMGQEAVSAASIANVMQQIGSVMLFGISGAAAVLTGKEIGRGNKELAKTNANTMLIVVLIIGAIMGGLLFVLKPAILNMYTLEASTVQIAGQMLNATSVYLLLDSVCSVWMVGIFRGGGDTRFAVLIDVLTLWFFSIPIGWICGLVLHMPAALTYIALKLDIPARLIVCAFRYRTGNWLRDVTREL